MLTQKALTKIGKNGTLKGRLADAMGKSMFTIHRWIKDNDPMLTTATALQIIREETGMSDDEILEPVKA